MLKILIPFLLISKLVTRRSASRGDLLKNFGGVMLGGRVVGFRLPPLLLISHARMEPWWSLSKCSVDAVVRVCRCFGYHPRAGSPILISSPFAWRAWLILRCVDRPPVLLIVVHPTRIFVDYVKTIYQNERNKSIVGYFQLHPRNNILNPLQEIPQNFLCVGIRALSKEWHYTKITQKKLQPPPREKYFKKEKQRERKQWKN